MVQYDKFSVRIFKNEQPAHEDDQGRVPLKDGSVYQISLKNYHDRDASAEVSIDGRPVGVYLVKAKSKLLVESPIGADGKFTFFKVASGPGADLKDADQTRDDLGLIKVTFTLFKNKLDEVSKNDLLEGIKRIFEEQNKRPINIWPFTTITINDVDPWWYRYRYRPSPWWETNPIVYCNHVQTGDPVIGPQFTTMTTCGGGTASKDGTFQASHSINMAAQPPYEGKMTSGFHQVVKQELEPGITGLTGESEKFYEEASEDKSLFDADSVRHLYLRLVAADEELVAGPRKLPRSTPIPPPV